ncbi:Predicted NTPase (NACHT family) [Mycobacteroides abscessus subsp. abscessus]|nr:Predicted NTPase (NACHT family) [Mycobacteroides abscessus subsp. abscessus]
MVRYELNRLGPLEFENLAQALLKEIIGNGTITFGAGADGAREATYTGKANYPSDKLNWSGKWVFQAKYHDIELQGIDKCRRALLRDLKSELEKITNQYDYRVDNYIMVTNVPLSGNHSSGNIDRIAEIASDYKEKISNITVWGADEVNRFLDRYPNVRTSYLHLVVPGDLIAALLTGADKPSSDIHKTIQSYIDSMYTRDQYAQLDQAGDAADKPVKLPKIFLELYAAIDPDSPTGPPPNNTMLALSQFIKTHNGTSLFSEKFPVVKFFLQSGQLRVVLVGGPGEGKSTAGQYLAQLHRAQLLGQIDEAAIDADYRPTLPRIPFRIILRDFGQWLSESLERGKNREKSPTLEEYICHHIEWVTSRSITAEDLHTVVRANPILLILDGLDEVTDPSLKSEVTDRSNEFIRRTQAILDADLQVLATTRPKGYNEQFEPGVFTHLLLEDLKPDQIRSYVSRWIQARDLDHSKSLRLTNGIESCLGEPNVRLLMKTPLQVTIIVLIISAGGTPPKQREALFNEYLEVIYKREQSKGADIITTNKELLIGLHKYIGYQLQERATHATATNAVLTTNDYRDLVREYAVWNNPYSKEREKIVRSITVDAGERLVLIVESVAGQYGFELRSLQEFFAACHLVDTSNGTQQRYARFESIVCQPHWSNVALFFAGRVGRNFQGEASNLVEVCRNVDRGPLDTYLKRGAAMALAIVRDRALLPNMRLHRSLLEVALAVLDNAAPARRIYQIEESLADLPDDDIATHVIPILESKMETLAPERLSQTIEVTLKIAPKSTALLHAIDRMAAAPSTAAAALFYALKLCQYQPKARKIVKKLLNNISEDEINSVLSQTSSFEEMGRWLKVLQEVDAPWPVQEALIRRTYMIRMQIRSSNTRYLEENSADIWDTPCTDSGMLLIFWTIRTAHTLQASAYQSRGSVPSSLLDRIDSLRSLAPPTVIRGQSASFAKAAGVTPTDPLMCAFWALHLMLGNTTPASIRRSLRFFSINYSDRVISDTLWSQFTLTPVLDYLRARLKFEADLDEIEATLLYWSGFKGLVRWAELFNRVNDFRTIRRWRETGAMLDVETISSLNGNNLSSVQRTTEKGFVRIEDNSVDIDFLFYLMEASRMRSRDWIQHVFPRWEDQISAVFENKYLTTARIQAINRMMYRQNSPHFPAEHVQKRILERLLLPEYADESRLIIQAYLSYCSVTTIDERLFRKVARAVGGMPVYEPLIMPDQRGSMKRFYETAINLANSSRYGELARRGACRLIVSAVLNTQFVRPSRNVQYKGFAAMHRQLCNRTDNHSRVAAFALFAVRTPWSVEDAALLRKLIVECDSDDQISIVATLIDLEVLHGKRIDIWISLLTDLLSVPLFKDLNQDVQHGLYALLQQRNQSLAGLEESLGLPLATITT